MSWQDRDYAHSDYDQRPGPMSGMRFVWPSLTPVVKKLLLANTALLILRMILAATGPVVVVGDSTFDLLEYVGSFVFDWAVLKGQIWRFLSYQYLHGGPLHLLFNMLGLYFLGTLLEQRWGGRKFFLLYSIFGVAGAVTYSILTAAEVFPRVVPTSQEWEIVRMVGASGSVLGLLGACAVAAPHLRVILFIFPVRIRTAATIFGAMYLFWVITSRDGAHACHLGGLLLGAVWVWLESRGVIKLTGRPGGTIGPSGRKWVHTKIRKGAWEKKMKRRQIQQGEIDRILKKIHDKGLASLSSREKKILKSASRDRPDYDNGFPPDPAQDN